MVTSERGRRSPLPKLPQPRNRQAGQSMVTDSFRHLLFGAELVTPMGQAVPYLLLESSA